VRRLRWLCFALVGQTNFLFILIILNCSEKHKYHKNIESLLDTSKEVSLEVSMEKEYIFMSHHQNHNIKVANISFENVAQFKYFELMVRNQN
jgi:hypothetical protein